MDVLSFVLEVLKMTLPSLAVFLVTYFVLKQYLENDYQKKLLENRKENAGQLMPVKMQAYERMILYMERINPSSLLVRLTTAGMTATELKTVLTHTINEEFNHNVAQQLYVSPQAWKIIRVVKEQLLQIINECYHGLDPDAKGVDLSRAILDFMIRHEEVPTDKAIDFLKKEFKLMFD
ncbi:MAG: hypothetical protein LPK45_01960 [Bacteroidota bacterium]|nr:hypothetical protein [Bacteroidota bacterium]